MIDETWQRSFFATGAEALVNPVNVVGVMGAGLARAIKERCPEAYATYREACLRGEVITGRMYTVKLEEQDKQDWGWDMPAPSYLINFPTKKHWKNTSQLSYIEEGVVDLAATVRLLEIKSIAIPALGCGYGSLDWRVVRPLIVGAFAPLPDVHVILFGHDRKPIGLNL